MISKMSNGRAVEGVEYLPDITQLYEELIVN